jgi:hypothetical protein
MPSSLTYFLILGEAALPPFLALAGDFLLDGLRDGVDVAELVPWVEIVGMTSSNSVLAIEVIVDTIAGSTRGLESQAFR